MAEAVRHQYSYISEVPGRQRSFVRYVKTVLAEGRPSVDQQYEEVGGNQTTYPQMYITPIQETNREETKKYENVPVTQVHKFSNTPSEACFCGRFVIFKNFLVYVKNTIWIMSNQERNVCSSGDAGHPKRVFLLKIQISHFCFVQLLKTTNLLFIVVKTVTFLSWSTPHSSSVIRVFV